MKTIQVSDTTAGIVSAILRIEQSCFPASWQYTNAAQFFSKALHDTNNINVALFHEQEIVGYALACPMVSVIKELKEHDPELDANTDAIYLETIAVLPAFQGQGGSMLLIEAIAIAAGLRGYSRLSMHARCVNHFNASVRQQFLSRVETSRFIDQWFYGGNEPYEFMVIALVAGSCNPQTLHRMAPRARRKHV